MFVNSVGIYRFKTKDSEINAALLCVGNVSKDFSVESIKKLDYTDMSITFQLIMIVLILMIFWISIKI